MVKSTHDGAKRKIRVLLSKFELESHDRGFSLVARMLRDAGMEVVLVIFRDPLEVVKIARDEAVDVVGLSALSGDTPKVFLSAILRHLRKNNNEDIPLVIAGGRIVGEDAKLLIEKGVNKIFGPGSQADEIVDYIRGNVIEYGLSWGLV